MDSKFLITNLLDEAKTSQQESKDNFNTPEIPLESLREETDDSSPNEAPTTNRYLSRVKCSEWLLAYLASSDAQMKARNALVDPAANFNFHYRRDYDRAERIYDLKLNPFVATRPDRGEEMGFNQFCDAMNRSDEPRATSMVAEQFHRFTDRFFSDIQDSNLTKACHQIQSMKHNNIIAPIEDDCLGNLEDKILRVRSRLNELQTNWVDLPRPVANHFGQPHQLSTVSSGSLLAPLSSLSNESINASRIASSHKRRKARTVFTDSQLSGLESRFEVQRYLSTPERYELADKLSLSETQVKTW